MTKPLENSDAEGQLLASMKREWVDMADLFGNRGASRRERWVVGEFLNVRGIAFTEDEVKSRPQDDPVDIDFREAAFQVKEIVASGSRRTGEIMKIARRVAAARTLEETLAPPTPTDTPDIADGNDVVLEEARELAQDRRYATTKAGIDLLFYMTRARTSLPRFQPSRVRDLELLGWRSISVLMTDYATVLQTAAGAPRFLVTGDSRSKESPKAGLAETIGGPPT